MKKLFILISLILTFLLVLTGCNQSYGQGYGATGRAATITIAGPYSTALEKSQADYVCTANASAAWITAIAAMPAAGGNIQVYSGNFDFTQSVHLTKPISISGTGYNTYFDYNGSSPVFISDVANCTYSNLRTDAGGLTVATGWLLDNVIVGTTWYAFANAGTTISASGISSSVDASNITSGTINTARLGSGTTGASVFLAGDSTWKVATSGVGIFGNGADGAVTISANGTTLSRDMYYSSLTINTNITLQTGGYRIFCTGTVTNNGIIDDSGGNGGNASSNTPGTGGTGNGGSLGGGNTGAPGQIRNPTTSLTASGGGGGGGGIILICAPSIINNGIIRANGGNGGASFAAVGVENSPGNGIAPSYLNSLGGSGAIGGNATTATGTGVGGTTGASAPAASETGFKSIPYAITLRLPSSGGFVHGGAGGNSGGTSEVSGGNSAAGGSGGGGGGLVVLVYSSITLGTIQFNGGTGSAAATYGTGTGTSGGTASTGTVIQIPN